MNYYIPRKHGNALFFTILLISQSAVISGLTKYKPVANQWLVEYHHTETGSRRKLEPFQVCLVCRCCVTVTDPTSCANMPCCFGIDCQLPNKPFGVCAFVPKTCNCTSCGAAV